MVIVDTNVLVDVLEDDPDWAEWSTGRVRGLSKIHELAINPVIYAELSLTFDAVEELDAVVSDMELKFMEIPRPALFLAGKAFVRYRKQGGAKTNVLSPPCLITIAPTCRVASISSLPTPIYRRQTFLTDADVRSALREAIGIMTASIATAAPPGRAAAPMAARAG